MKYKIPAILFTFFCVSIANAATEWSAQDYDLYPGDFDGDGRTDLLYVAKDSAKASGIAKSDASGGTPTIGWQSWHSNHLGIPWNDNQYLPHVADFNGDGKSDVFMQRSTPGDSFLLIADENGKISSILQTVPNYYLGLYWSADQHKIAVGDFNGNGKADVFLQATSVSGTNAVVLTDSSGQFSSGPAQNWTYSQWGAFRWSTQFSNVFVGDFNNDGASDLLIQAKPGIVMIDYDVPIPVPVYQANSFGLVLSDGDSTPLQQLGVRQWSRNAHGVDWASNSVNVVVGNFDASGGSDVLLQARVSGRPSYLLHSNASEPIFSTGSTASANVTFSGDTARVIAGNFDGGSAVGIYVQANVPSGTNSVANSVSTSISASTHTPLGDTGVVAANAAGRTPGSFAVSNMGAATYSIPIEVPPGVMGVQPHLGLTYSSRAENGWLGVGWNIGGLSKIERCVRTWEQDGEGGAIELTLLDQFCLDRNKLRLASGGQGQAGSTYYTELETFSHIKAVGTAGAGPQYFEVKAKNGLTYQYGSSSNSRIEALVSPSAASNTVHVWLLNKVTDRSNNTMTIKYLEDGTPYGSYRPDEITYGAGTTETYKVKFTWDTRASSDYVNRYVGGLMRETKRLNRIETYYNTTLVRKYQLSYRTGGTLRSQLTALQECDGSSNCLSPTLFNWQEGTAGWSSAGELELSAPTDVAYALDMNSDSRSDLLYPELSGGSMEWFIAFANESGGFDAAIDTNMPAGTASTYGTATPFFGASGIASSLLGNSGTHSLWSWVGYDIGLQVTPVSLYAGTQGGIWTGDFNADGRGDFIASTYGSGSANFYLHKATSGGSFASPTLMHSATSTPAVNPLNRQGMMKLVDINGDGRTDVIARTSTNVEHYVYIPDLDQYVPYQSSAYHWTAYLSTGTSFVYAGAGDIGGGCAYESGEYCPQAPIVTGDFNGDGLTDVLWGHASASSGWVYSWYVSFGSAAGLTGTTAVTLPNDAFVGVVAGDFTGDGRDDVLYPSQATGNATLMMAQWNGSDFASGVSTGMATSSMATVRVLDVNGDGLQDIGYYGNGKYRVRKHNGPVPDLIRAFTDGLGNQVNVTYSSLTSDVFTKSTTAAWPTTDVQPAMQVVKQYVATDGVGGTYTVSEQYVGAHQNNTGRGFLGFTQRTETENRANRIKRQWDIETTFPLTGQLTAQRVYHSTSNTLVSNTTYEYATKTPASGRPFPYLKEVIEDVNEVGGSLNGTAITRKTTTIGSMGDFGTPLTETIELKDIQSGGPSYNEVFKQEVVNSNMLDDNGTNWCVGRPRQTVITDTLPNSTSRVRTQTAVVDAPMCRVTKETVEPNSNPLKVVTDYTYDSSHCGNVTGISVTGHSFAGVALSPRNTTLWYDGAGACQLPRRIQDALGNNTDFTYDFRFGLTATHTDPNGLQAETFYDGFGRPFLEELPDNTSTLIQYTACNVANNYCGTPGLRMQVKITSRDNTTAAISTSYAYMDSLGRTRLSQQQSASGLFSTVDTRYDNYGRVASRSVPYFDGFNGRTVFAYDAMGRQTSAQLRDAADTVVRTSSIAFAGRTASLTSPLNKVTAKVYDVAGQLRKVTDPTITTTTLPSSTTSSSGFTTYGYTFESDGVLVFSVTDAMSNVTTARTNRRGFKTQNVDLDMGIWNYEYDSLGELTKQTDAKAQDVTFVYDALGRATLRREPEGTTVWQWGTASDNSNLSPGKYIGQLRRNCFIPNQSATDCTGASYKEEYEFNALGRPSATRINIDSDPTYTIGYTYQAATGLLETLTYPTSSGSTPLKVQYDYQHGIATKVRDADNLSTVFWQLNNMDARGNYTDESLGNGLRVLSNFDAATGLMLARQSGIGSSTNRQNLSYLWDANGNLTERRDNNQNVYENFWYDDLNRMDYSKLNGSTVNLDLTVNAIGNVTYKSDAGMFSYGYINASYKGGPHALTGINSVATNNYDANGNMTTRAGSPITWTSYNMPSVINGGGQSSTFSYGPDRSRYKQVATYSTGNETTYYIGGLMEKVLVSSGTAYRHYIAAGSSTVVHTRWNSGSPQTHYVTSDHLGSFTNITDSSGAVVVNESFAAFGKRRGTNWTGSPTTTEMQTMANTTRRGFTGHEHLDNLGLIHMNGRVFDPSIARFLSADPIVQMPDESQSLNRYSYTFNNPLSYVDPSGYCAKSRTFSTVGNPFYDDQGNEGLAPPEFCIIHSAGIPAGWLPKVDSGGSSGNPGNWFYADLGLELSGPESSTVDGGHAQSWHDAFDYTLWAFRATWDDVSSSARLVWGGLARWTFNQYANSDAPLAGGPIGISFGPRVFPNLMSRQFSAELAAAARVGAVPIRAGTPAFNAAVNSGTIKWVVTESGELLVTPAYVGGLEISHAVLSGGKGVLAAGQAEIAAAGGKYVGIELTPWSGHFQPSAESLAIGRAAFERIGIIF